ncbi:alpha/beta hydrolase [Hymenobacter taeanensis]|uniref:Alpha/beta hydrolase n=1 Tax=Hymenobacter taeanensis TaxID=2735321 RepID=A0A6M6BHB0_9BACT|nr:MULTISPECIES: alpha/beta hydrolase [Hymenobacter]QJX47430.1 alpha/beta hydrolase [Hymenobacter taeanensis]UOQ83088.1 alpha/beta hydrolase [Hymenobacter sp. 5414T-23]
MRKLVLLFFTCLTTVTFTHAQTQPVIPLYSGAVPNSKPSQTTEAVTKRPDGSPRISQVVQPTLTVYKAAKPNGTAVIVCPGGGYAMLAMDHEGHDVARRFNVMGITAFVLKYRLPLSASQTDKSITPLLDAQQAIRLVRQKASEYAINPARIGLMGFSAGGHLASTAGTHFARPVGDTKDQTSVRPDFLMLIYPVISLSDSLMHKGSRDNLIGDKPTAEQTRLYSNELQVTAQTPPTFLVHAQDDNVVKVQNALVFYAACLHHKVPVEMHLYPQGGHGFGMNNKTTKDNWTDRLQNWLDAGGWLK